MAYPDRKLIDAAGRDGAIILFYNISHRPAVLRIKATRSCFDLTRGTSGTLACPARTVR